MKKMWVLWLATLVLLLAGCGVAGGINAPFSNEECVRVNADDVVDQLKNAGFTDIELIEEKTAFDGFDGLVKSVKIGSNTMYNTANTFSPDTHVIITYYGLTDNARAKAEEKERKKAEEAAAEEAAKAEEAEAADIEAHRFSPTIQMEVDGNSTMPTLVFHTNLPEGTILSINIITDDDFDFNYEAKLTVEGGEAQTEQINNNGDELFGVYNVSLIAYNSEQPQIVTAVFGDNGKYLTGDCVVTADDINYVAKDFIFTTFSYEDAIEEVRQALNAGDVNYELEYDENTVKIITWGDGMAACATLASLGDENNLQIWDSTVETLRKLSESIELNILKAKGFSVPVSITLRNDANSDNVLYVAVSGEVVYDAVALAEKLN